MMERAQPSEPENKDQVEEKVESLAKQVYSIFDWQNLIAKIRDNQCSIVDLAGARIFNYIRPALSTTLLGCNGASTKHLIALSNGWLISTYDRRDIKVWDVMCLSNIATLSEQNGYVQCLSQLSNGKLASASQTSNSSGFGGSGYKYSIKIWDIENAKCIATLNEITSSILCLIALPDGRLASGLDDKTISIWDITRLSCIATLNGHDSPIQCLAVLPGNKIASGSNDGCIKIWDLGSLRCIATAKEHTGAIHCLAVLSDGRLSSGSSDKTIKIWDIARLSCIATLNKHNYPIQSLAVLPDGCLASGSSDSVTNQGCIKIWETERFNCIATLSGYASPVECLAVLSDGRLASGSSDRDMASNSSRSCIKIWEGHEKPLLSIKQLVPLFTALKANKSVHMLNLKGLPLCDANIPLLIELFRANQTIENLNIYETGITYQGALALHTAIAERPTKLIIEHDALKVHLTLTDRLNRQQAYFENLIHELRADIDRLSFVKSNNSLFWQYSIASHDMARIQRLITANADPCGISFIPIAEEKLLQPHIANLRAKKAVFTLMQLIEDTDAALSASSQQALPDKRYLKRLRTGIIQLLDLWRERRLNNQTAQQLMDRAALSKLEKLVSESEEMKIIFSQKIQIFRGEKHQAWLRSALPPMQLFQLDEQVIHYFQRKLKAEQLAGNLYLQIQYNIRACFVGHLQQGSLPNVDQFIETIVTEIAKCYQKGQLDKNLGATIAKIIANLKDPLDFSAQVTESLLTKAIQQLFQLWQANQLGDEEKAAREALANFIGANIEPQKCLEQGKWSVNVKAMVEKDALCTLFRQLRNNQLQAAIAQELSTQILQLFQGQKAVSAIEGEEGLKQLLLSWQRQELSPEDSALIYQRATDVWQERLLKLNQIIQSGEGLCAQMAQLSASLRTSSSTDIQSSGVLSSSLFRSSIRTAFNASSSSSSSQSSIDSLNSSSSSSSSRY